MTPNTWDLEDWFRLAILVFQPFILAGLGRLLHSIDQLTKSVNLQNGRIVRIEEWRLGHEMMAQSTFADIKAAIRRLERNDD